MSSLNGVMSASTSAMDAGAKGVGASAENISNLQSTAFKRVVTSYSSQSTRASSSNFNPGGVTASVRRLIDEVGQTTSTTSATDLMIDGQGAFVVAPDPSRPEAALFSRTGNFRLSAERTLVDNEGRSLLGWRTDEEGTPLTANLNSLDELSPIDLSVSTGVSRPTTKFEFGMNLPTQKPSDGSYEFTVNEFFFDSLGASHSVAFTWHKTDATTWKLSISSPDAAQVKLTDSSGADYLDIPITFDSNGAPATFNGGAPGAMPDIYIKWNTPAADSKINLNLGDVGKRDGLTALYGEQVVTKREQDGVRVGNFSYVSISSDGVVTAFYDNQSSLPIYRIPVAMVPNFQGLQSVGSGAFAVTTDSGAFSLTVPGQGGSGGLQSNKLELSVVDVATEFASMTLGQQMFSAAAQSFRTATEMMNELKHLKS